MGWRVLGQPWGSFGGSLGTRIGGGAGYVAPPVPLVYLLKDLFTTADASPITSPRTCEPGPGTLVVVADTGNTLSIAGGQLVTSGGASVSDPQIKSGETFARADGLMLHLKSVNPDSGSSFKLFAYDNANNFKDGYYIISGTGSFRPYQDGVQRTYYSAFGVSDTYDILLVMRTTGCFFITKGDGFSDYTILFPSVDSTFDPIEFRVAIRGAGEAFNDVRVANLTSPWDNQYGIATQRLAGARSPGDTFVHVADCFIEMEVATIPAAGQIELWFRKQDATNYWAVTVNSAGDLELDEVVGGGTTQRGVSAAVIANSDRVVLEGYDETIRVFEQNFLRITYAVAANFKTETDGELDTEGTGGAVTDIISWPKVLSGNARTVLDNYING